MPETHAQIARRLVAGRSPSVFAHAARDLVIDGNPVTLERMLPGTMFACRKVDSEEWELVGTCRDGSVCIWRVGA